MGWRRLQSIDRRWIFLAMAVAVLWPTYKPIGLPVTVTREAQSLYDAVEALPAGSALLLGVDYGPSTEPELTPMGKAVIRHAVGRGVRVVMISLLADAPGIGNELLMWSQSELGAVDGADIAYLGYKAGTSAVILAMGTEVAAAFPTDYKGNALADLPIMEGLESLPDFDLIIGLEATGVMDVWIQYAGDGMEIPVGGGVTAVSAPEYYVFLQSGQMVGLLGGMKGGAEYEALVAAPDSATMGMDAQSLGHFVIVLFIILGNLGYLLGGRAGEGSRLKALGGGAE